MKIKITHKLLLYTFFILTVLALLAMRLTAQALTLPNNTFEVQGSTASPSVPKWTYREKIKEGLKLIEGNKLELKVDTKDIIFNERRISQNKGRILVIQKQVKEPEREVGLVLLNTNTGGLSMIKTTEKGDKLSVPSGYKIEYVERANGIIKNAWNTQRIVIEPADTIVLLDVWPHFVTKKAPKNIKDKKGRVKTVYEPKKIVENVVYSPYSDGLRVSELVEAGPRHRKSDVQEAFDLLRARQVQSKAIPGNLINDLKNILKPEFFERLPLLEQADYTEFLFDPKKTLERVDVIIGANDENAYAPTCSKKGACGWVQYTRRTYEGDKKHKGIRQIYPDAQLISDFETGAADHVNSMMAAILLYDYNLAGYLREFGNSILNDSDQLEEILASSYNGAPAHAHKSLNASILQGLDDWITKYLKTETKEYMIKLRYIRDNYKN